MADTAPNRSPLARLVLFLVCLAAVCGILTGLYYSVVILPQQHAVTVPKAVRTFDNVCDACLESCNEEYHRCYADPAVQQECLRKLYRCVDPCSCP